MNSKIDKFTFPLKKGFNELNVISKVSKGYDGQFGAIVPFFSIEKAGKCVKICETYGWRAIWEDDIESARKAYQKQPNGQAYLDMLDRIENLFERIRNEELSIPDLNKELKEKTEEFYQHYIAGETITQIYNPMAREHLPKLENDDNRFLIRRLIQKMDKKIGAECEIPHENIRRTFNLD